MVVGHSMVETAGGGPAGILLTPIHTYSTGNLFMQEHTILKQLNNASIGVDVQVQLCIDPNPRQTPGFFRNIMFGRLLFVTFGTLNPLPLEPSSKPGWQRSAPYVLPGSVPTASFNAQKHQGLDMEVWISFQEPQEFG